MTTVITKEQQVAGHRVAEHSGRSHKLVYVDEQLVTTQWEETLEILGRGDTPVAESCASAMHRVLSCF